MGLFDAFKNKSGKSQKTSYSCGNKYITESKVKKSGGIKTGLKTTTKPVKRSK